MSVIIIQSFYIITLYMRPNHEIILQTLIYSLINVTIYNCYYYYYAINDNKMIVSV